MVYKIIESSDSITLAEAITIYLRDGWHLAGGVTVCISQSLGRTTVYAQAITKDN